MDWKGRRVAVAGGRGFIGRALVRQLQDRGAVVRVWSKTDGDLAEVGKAQACLNNAEVLFNLAGHVGGISYNRTHPATLFRRNMAPFLTLMDIAARRRMRVVVVSSACVYSRDGDLESPPEPMNRGYGWAKRMQEYLAIAYADEHGLDCRVARPFNAYGPGDDFGMDCHVIPALIRKVESGENPLVVWGDGTCTRTFLYVDDCARGLIEVAESGSIVPTELASDEEISIGDLARKIVHISGKDVDIEFDTERPNGQLRRRPTPNEFKAQISLDEGLRRTIEYYRGRYRESGGIPAFRSVEYGGDRQGV